MEIIADIDFVSVDLALWFIVKYFSSSVCSLYMICNELIIFLYIKFMNLIMINCTWFFIVFVESIPF